MIYSMYTVYILHSTYIGQRIDILYRRPLWTTVGSKKVEPETRCGTTTIRLEDRGWEIYEVQHCNTFTQGQEERIPKTQTLMELTLNFEVAFHCSLIFELVCL